MSKDSTAPPRINLDHELLWRLSPENTPEEWEKTLRRSGLWNLTPSGSEQGKLVRELVRTVEVWPRGQLATVPNYAPTTTQQWGALGLAGVVLGGVLVSSFVVGVAAITALIVAYATWVLFLDRSGAQSVAASASAPEGKRATRVLRQLLGRTFVDVAGETIVENLPHRDYLELRMAEVERALIASEGRAAELSATLAGIRGANARLGRPGDDPETANLVDAIAVEHLMRAKIEGVRAHLRERRAAFDTELDRLRVLAERRALSERVARLTEAGVGEEAVRAAADIEVDVAGIEVEVAALQLGAIDQDARLRAVLEVVGAQRR